MTKSKRVELAVESARKSLERVAMRWAKERTYDADNALAKVVALLAAARGRKRAKAQAAKGRA